MVPVVWKALDVFCVKGAKRQVWVTLYDIAEPAQFSGPGGWPMLSSFGHGSFSTPGEPFFLPSSAYNMVIPTHGPQSMQFFTTGRCCHFLTHSRVWASSVRAGISVHSPSSESTSLLPAWNPRGTSCPRIELFRLHSVPPSGSPMDSPHYTSLSRNPKSFQRCTPSTLQGYSAIWWMWNGISLF